MSKHIERIPLSRIERIAICVPPKAMTLEAAMRAQPVEPDIGINGGYYSGWKPVAHLKSDGKVLAADPWGDWGYGWDQGADIRMLSVPGGGGTLCSNHITCKTLLSPEMGIDTPLDVAPELTGRRGRTALALDDQNLIIWCSSDGADGITLPTLRQALYEMGAKTAIALDGGQSCKYRVKGGSVYITNAKRPEVQHYIFIWLRPGKKTYYRVQVGSFTVKANAVRLLKELAGKGYKGYIQEVEL